MPFSGVEIVLQSGQLGLVGDVGSAKPALIVMMASAPTGHAFGDVKGYSRFDDLPEELQAIDACVNYFDLAEDRELLIMPVVNTEAIKDVVLKTHTTPYAKNLINAADSNMLLVGVAGTLLLADLAEACTNAQALADSFRSSMKLVTIRLPYSYKNADVAIDLLQRTDKYVGVIVSYQGDEVGTYLGKKTSSPVQRHPGRVKDGALPLSVAILDGYEAPAWDIKDYMNEAAALHDKGYIVLRTHIGKSGYFFANDTLAVAATDDYSKAYLRDVIDKATLICAATYVNELHDDLDVDADGKLHPGVVKYLQEIIENAIDGQMTADGEISACSAFVDADQNIISAAKTEIVVGVTPKGYNNEIKVSLGFVNPAV